VGAADLFWPDYIGKRKTLHFSAQLNASANEQLLIRIQIEHGVELVKTFTMTNSFSSKTGTCYNIFATLHRLEKAAFK